MMENILDSLDSVGLFLVASSFMKTMLLFCNGFSDKKAKAMAAAAAKERKLVGKVERLFIYPVKSISGIEVKELDFKSEGASSGEFFDRQFMITTGPDHTFLTLRTVPTLLLIKPKLLNGQLILEAPSMSPITVKLNEVIKRKDLRQTAVHGGAALALDCGDEAANWLNKFLNRSDCRLLYSSTLGNKRSVNGGSVKYAAWTKNIPPEHKMNFQDSAPYHIISKTSVDDINAKLSQPVYAENFRANIVVSGSSAFSEDSWNQVYIGNTELSTVKLCSRCLVTTVDPKLGTRLNDNEPLKTLRGYRKLVELFGDGPCLGTHLDMVKEGKVKVGDNIYAVIGPKKLTPD